MAQRMSKRGKGKNSFATNQPVSTTAPRAPGSQGQGGNWRAGIMSQGQVGRIHQPFQKLQGPVRQGSSVANMGDQMSTKGHNVPRGYFSRKEASKGIFAAGSTPLSKTGTRKGKVAGISSKANAAAQITGPFGW